MYLVVPNRSWELMELIIEQPDAVKRAKELAAAGNETRIYTIRESQFYPAAQFPKVVVSDVVPKVRKGK